MFNTAILLYLQMTVKTHY